MKQPLKDWRGRVIPNGWQAISDIPNQAGLLVSVLLNDGVTTRNTKVRRNNQTGFHTLIGVRCADCLGWKQRTI